MREEGGAKGPDVGVRRDDVCGDDDVLESVSGWIEMSSEVCGILGRKSHLYATCRQLSPSPPTTSTHLSRNSPPSSARPAKGVWLCTNMLSSRGTSNLLLSSATRSDSCLPPPLVRRIKGILFFWRWARDL